MTGSERGIEGLTPLALALTMVRAAMTRGDEAERLPGTWWSVVAGRLAGTCAEGEATADVATWVRGGGAFGGRLRA